MKIVINSCFGGFFANPKVFRHPEKYLDEHGHFDYFGNGSIRTDPDLISYVESKDYTPSETTCLKVVDIPDEATDYRIIDYDGSETVLYVLNGKIYSVDD